jgi:hypothetical protein
MSQTWQRTWRIHHIMSRPPVLFLTHLANLVDFHPRSVVRLETLPIHTEIGRQVHICQRCFSFLAAAVLLGLLDVGETHQCRLAALDAAGHDGRFFVENTTNATMDSARVLARMKSWKRAPRKCNRVCSAPMNEPVQVVQDSLLVVGGIEKLSWRSEESLSMHDHQWMFSHGGNSTADCVSLLQCG